MSTFPEDLLAFTRMVEEKQKAIHAEIAHQLEKSVVDGSGTTGAPGQPVQTGNLRTSWNLRFPEDLVAHLMTNVEYAPAIEEGIGPHGEMTLRSEVGGFHSVKLTIAGYPKVVREAMDKVATW